MMSLWSVIAKKLFMCVLAKGFVGNLSGGCIWLFRFRYSLVSLDVSLQRVKGLPTRVKEIMEKLWDLAPDVEPSRVRMHRAFRGYMSRCCPAGDLLHLRPPARAYGACFWEDEVLRLYEGDSVKALTDFLQDVRCRAQFYGVPSGLGAQKGFFPPTARFLARRIVSGMNIGSMDYEDFFHGVLLQECIKSMDVLSMREGFPVEAYIFNP